MVWLTHTFFVPGVLVIVGAVVVCVPAVAASYHNKLLPVAGVGADQLPVPPSQKLLCVGAVGAVGVPVTVTSN